MILVLRMPCNAEDGIVNKYMGDNKKMNPQRALFKEYYCNPESDTFSNAYQSAKRAGFAENYAKTILNKENVWVEEIVRDLEMTTEAEKVLNEMLKMTTSNVIERGDEILVKTDSSLVKIKQDTAKFVSERLNKVKWSQRTELGGLGGKDLIPDEGVKEHIDKVLDNYFNGRTKGN